MAIARSIGVVGFGLMGSGIAQVCAQAGYEVIVREVDRKYLDAGFKRLDASLARFLERGKLTTEEAAAARARVHGTTSLTEFAGCRIVIEAIIENIAEKRKLFAELDQICPQETIFASNTSSLPIVELAATTKRPDRFAGMHFFNPPQLMKLVEIVRAITTSEATIESLRGFVGTLGKTAVVCKDTPGFIVNRLLVPYMLTAIRALEEGVASADEIDQAMVLGAGYPMGPFTLLDYVGLDTTYYVANILFDEFKDPSMAPPTLLKRLVLAGHYGRKTGQGFYRYDAKGEREK
jgi:3-hydroxybutyryl-CoA dehydrogenase